MHKRIFGFFIFTFFMVSAHAAPAMSQELLFDCSRPADSFEQGEVHFLDIFVTSKENKLLFEFGDLAISYPIFGGNALAPLVHTDETFITVVYEESSESNHSKPYVSLAFLGYLDHQELWGAAVFLEPNQEPIEFSCLSQTDRMNHFFRQIQSNL